jgi:hypothetical protein
MNTNMVDSTHAREKNPGPSSAHGGVMVGVGQVDEARRCVAGLPTSKCTCAVTHQNFKFWNVTKIH